MARGEISAGKAFVELFLKQSGFVRGLDSAGRRLRAWGASAAQIGGTIAAAGTAITAPLVNAAFQFTDAAAAMQKLSQQTGATVEELSRLRYAADRLGIDAAATETSDLIGAVEELNLRLGEVILYGTGPAADALKQLGLDAQSLADQSIIGRFETLADAIGSIQDEAMRGFLADEMFGGDAFKILPLLRQGSAGIRAMADEADRLGITLSSDAAESAQKFNMAWGKLTTSIGAAVRSIGSALVPVLLEATEAITPLVANAVRWAKENQAIVRTVFAVGAALVTAGTAIAAFGGFVTIAGFALSGLATAVTALLTPLGAIAAAVAGAATYWVRFAESAQTAKQAVMGIVDALLSGNLELAGQIAIEGLRQIVLAGFTTLADLVGGIWGDTIAFVGDSLLASDLQSAMDAGLEALSLSWKRFAAFMVNIAAEVSKQVIGIWSGMVSSLSSLILDAAAQDGIIGEAFSKLLGVDVRGEIERRNRLNAEAAAKGLPTQEGFLDAAKGAATQQTQAAARRAAAAIDDIALSFHRDANRAEERLRTHIGTRTSPDDSRFQALLEQAAREREDRRRGLRLGGGPQGEGVLGPLGTGPQVAASFSAAALGLLGAGGGDKVVRGLEKVEKKADEGNKILGEIRDQGGGVFV